MASIEGLRGEAALPAYNAAKGGVRIFSRSVAIHCARSGYNIRVNNICPGFAETQMVSGALATLAPNDAQAFAEKTMARIPMGRFARPAERKSVVWGKSVPVRLDQGGRRLIKKKNQNEPSRMTNKLT